MKFLSLQRQTSLTGGAAVTVRMCVAVKRKLQLYYWKQNEFLKLAEDINLIELPKALAWCGDTICVGFREEYTLYQLNGKATQLFPPSSSRSSDPCVVKVSNKTFALGRESQTVLVNVDGELEKTKALKWSQVPCALGWDEPFMLGLIPEGIEVNIKCFCYLSHGKVSVISWTLILCRYQSLSIFI